MKKNLSFNWMISVYLYKNLLYLRKKFGWTQAEMQDRCGVSRMNWSHYENGNTEPDLQTAARISLAFGVSLDDLVLKNLSEADKNVNANLKSDAVKNRENVNLNVNPSVNLIDQKQGNMSQSTPAQTLGSQPDNVGTWAILGQLQRIEEKIDQMRASGNNDTETTP